MVPSSYEKDNDLGAVVKARDSAEAKRSEIGHRCRLHFELHPAPF